MLLTVANRNEGTVIAYDKVVNHVLRRYTTDTVIAEADGEIRSFKKARQRRGISRKSFRI